MLSSYHTCQHAPRRTVLDNAQGYQNFSCQAQLVEEANDFAGHMLSPRLLVVHDARRGGEDNVSELTRRQQLDDPFLKVPDANIVAGGDDAGFVESMVPVSVGKF